MTEVFEVILTTNIDGVEESYLFETAFATLNLAIEAKQRLEEEAKQNNNEYEFSIVKRKVIGSIEELNATNVNEEKTKIIGTYDSEEVNSEEITFLS